MKVGRPEWQEHQRPEFKAEIYSVTFSSNVNLKGNLYKCVLEIRWEQDISFNTLHMDF